MNWLHNWLAARRLKREWDRGFYVWAAVTMLHAHIEEHIAHAIADTIVWRGELSVEDAAREVCRRLADDHDAHVAAYQAAPR